MLYYNVASELSRSAFGEALPKADLDPTMDHAPHRHGPGIAHTHGHHHAPGVPHPPAALPLSLLRMPASVRLAGATLICGLMWAAIIMAMRS
jgi:hypothetical protein